MHVIKLVGVVLIPKRKFKGRHIHFCVMYSVSFIGMLFHQQWKYKSREGTDRGGGGSGGRKKQTQVVFPYLQLLLRLLPDWPGLGHSKTLQLPNGKGMQRAEFDEGGSLNGMK